MIEVTPGGEDVIWGRFAPTWGGLYQFGNGRIMDGQEAFEFAAGDKTWRVHIRMMMQADDEAWVVGWIDPSDWLTMMQTANRGGGMLRQLLAKRLELQAMSRRLGESVPLGLFRRIATPDNPGKFSLPASGLQLADLPPLSPEAPPAALVPLQIPPQPGRGAPRPGFYKKPLPRKIPHCRIEPDQKTAADTRPVTGRKGVFHRIRVPVEMPDSDFN